MKTREFQTVVNPPKECKLCEDRACWLFALLCSSCLAHSKCLLCIDGMNPWLDFFSSPEFNLTLDFSSCNLSQRMEAVSLHYWSNIPVAWRRCRENYQQGNFFSTGYFHCGFETMQCQSCFPSLVFSVVCLCSQNTVCLCPAFPLVLLPSELKEHPAGPGRSVSW